MVSAEEDKRGEAMGEVGEAEVGSMQEGEDTSLHVIFDQVFIVTFTHLEYSTLVVAICYMYLTWLLKTIAPCSWFGPSYKL